MIKISGVILFILACNIFGAGANLPPVSATVSPRIQKKIAEEKIKFDARCKCYQKYRPEISKRTAYLSKQLNDSMAQETAMAAKLEKSNTKIHAYEAQIQDLRKKYHGPAMVKNDTIAMKQIKEKPTQDEVVARQKQIKADALQKKELIKSVMAEKRKINEDPAIVEIRRSIKKIQTQIADTIAVIVNDDQECKEYFTVQGGK
jgi:DNA repair exonuclease SbcCD ATPase subunit